MKYDLHREDLKLQHQLPYIELRMITSEILNYYEAHPDLAEKYQLELNYLREEKTDIDFPYRRLKRLETIHSGYDKKLKLPYIVHKDKKLYFPSTCPIDHAENVYRSLVENDDILGNGYRKKTPHQYQTEDFPVKETDTLLDVGCAEALFSLDLIDKVKKVYLVESDPDWFAPLNATFESYKDKVKIIPRLVSNVDSDTTITLSSLLKDEELSSLFIKMDIEGYETSVIEASKETLSKCKDTRIACCTYHLYHDADILSKLFTSMDYETAFSDGYMIAALDVKKPPYFRKGLIRARKE
jgi:hypothetical protein